MSNPDFPNFQSSDFLEQHIQSILTFYDHSAEAPEGFFHCFKDNSEIYDANTRHLVSSTRFIFNYATAYRLYGLPQYRHKAVHGLEHLIAYHRQDNGNYAWELDNHKVTDGRAMAYGHAFVLLCASSCLDAGIDEANPLINQTWNFVENYFWDEQFKAYADERDSSLDTLNAYRGQNANMHMCEALLAAWNATAQVRFLDRAELLANRVCFELTEQTNGLIWEHYKKDWSVDMQYNIDKPDDLFKPWGFQPGHQVEWTKLLLQLNEHRPNSKWVTKAKDLFDQAITKGWDKQHGGLVYGFSPDGEFCDAHKYFWVHAEAIAASWRLYKVTGESQYLDSYEKLWQWSWTYLIDHEHGAWFRIRNRDGSAYDDLKSPPGKTDYHTLGAVWDVLSQQ